MQDRARHLTVRLPSVADLACQVLGVPSFAPVPLVGVKAGLELAAEERPEPRGQAGSGLGLDQSFDDEEAVPAKALNIRRTRLFDQKHRSSLTPAAQPVGGVSFSQASTAAHSSVGKAWARSGNSR